LIVVIKKLVTNSFEMQFNRQGAKTQGTRRLLPLIFATLRPGGHKKAALFSFTFFGEVFFDQRRKFRRIPDKVEIFITAYLEIAAEAHL
jgi:hypothetical protein